jgi:phosphoglucosamine mutase
LLARSVVASAADLGLAWDGDADRLLAVDSRGEVVDGDQILAIVALDRQSRGALKGDAVVGTVMANLGFHRAMERAGIRVVTTPVGDRFVLEALRHEDLEVGGEQSGHTLFLDLATTGDGILTALQLAATVCRSGQSLDKLAAVVERHPQELRNVRVTEKSAVAASAAVQNAVAAAEARLGADGRVLLRPSGTENLVRVMVEAGDAETAREVVEQLADVIQRCALGPAEQGEPGTTR